MSAQASRLDELFGLDAMVLQFYGPGGDTIGAILGSRIADVKIHRGRASATEEAGAGTIALTLVGGLGVNTDVDLHVGLACRFQFDDTNLPMVDQRVFNDVFNRWTGQLTDIGDVEVWHNQTTMVVPVSGSTVLARLGNTKLARVPWVAGTSDRQIVLDVLGDVWANDPGVRIAEWADDPAPWLAKVTARLAVPESDRFVQWDVDNQPAPGVITELVASTGGVLVDTGSGLPDWITPEARRGAPIAAVLDASQIIAPLKVGQALADVCNAITVTWGPSDAQATAYAEDQDSITTNGILDGAITTRLADADAAARRAGGIVGRYAWPEFRLPSVSVDILELIRQGNAALAEQVLLLDLGSLVELDGLPTTSPVPGGVFWVEALDDAIGRNAFMVTLGLVPYVQLAPDVQWGDVPADITWDDYPADVSWNRATTWSRDGRPTAVPHLAWRSTASNITWASLAPGITWNTWEG